MFASGSDICAAALSIALAASAATHFAPHTPCASSYKMPGLAIVVAGAWLLWRVAAAVARFLLQLKPDHVGLVAASIAAAASVISISLSKAYEARIAIRQDLRSKRIPVYEGIVNTTMRIMLGEKAGLTPLTEKELGQWFLQTTEKLTIWGSDDLIRAFGNFNNGAAERSGIHGLYELETLLLAIRRDLGHKNKNLARGSVLRLWVTDMDEILKERKPVP